MALVPKISGLEIRKALPGSDDYVAARRLHGVCYVEAGYVLEDDLDDRGWIEDIWVPVSDYFIAVESETGEIVGTCRAIRPTVRGLPAFIEAPTHSEAMAMFADIDPNQCFEISALATRRTGRRNTGISAMLYATVMQEALAHDRAYLIALMDNRFLQLMRRWFHFPFEAVGRSLAYMGSPSTPVALYVPRVVEYHREHLPESLSFFCGDIARDELHGLVIDLRNRVPEYQMPVLDLTVVEETPGSYVEQS